MFSKDPIARSLIQIGMLVLALLPVFLHVDTAFATHLTAMPSIWWFGVAICVLIVSMLEIRIGNVCAWFTPTIILGVLLSYPSYVVLLLSIAAIGLGSVLRQTRLWQPKYLRRQGWQRGLWVVFAFGQQLGLITAGLFGFFLLGGSITTLWQRDIQWLPWFGMVFNTLTWQGLASYAEQLLTAKNVDPRSKSNNLWFWVWQVLPATLPTLFGYYLAWQLHSLTAFPQLGLLGLLTALIGLLFWLAQQFIDMRHRHEQLTALSNVTRYLRTSLSLPSLLETIYLQVAHLLKVENFYIALYDEKNGKITYPIAIEQGKTVHWSERNVANRLTDRVIQTRTALLIANDLRNKLSELGFEPSGNYPNAWLGVPLTAGNALLGCMAVLSYDETTTFGDAEHQLLATIASQAAVAIENAQLYSETQQRTTELTLLNRLTTQMSVSLNPDRVLELVCSACKQLLATNRVVVFLLAAEHQELWLARAEGVGDSYLQASLTLSVVHNTRAKTIILQEPVVIADTEAVVLDAEWAAVLKDEHILAYVEMPLMTQGKPIGFIGVYYNEKRRFRSAEIDLFRTLTNQAALSLSNARMHVQTDQALSNRLEQLRVLETLGREISASLDTEHIFKIVLERAVAASLAAAGVLLIVRGNDSTHRLVVASHLGFLEQAVAQVAPNRQWHIERGIAGRVFLSGRTEVIADVRTDPDYVMVDPTTRSLLAVPVLQEQDVLGVIVLESPHIAAFGSDQATLVSQLAVQAAIAIVNAQLYADSQSRLSEQTLLYETGQIATSPLWDDALLARLADKIIAMLGVKAVILSELDLRKQCLTTFFQYTQPAWQPNFAYVTTRTLVTPPVSAELQLVLEDKLPLVLAAGAPEGWLLTPQLQHKPILMVPMLVGNTMIGLVEVIADDDHEFSDVEIRLAQTVAAQIATGMQNSRLFRDIRTGHDQITTVLSSVREGIMLVDTTGCIALFNARLSEWFEIPAEQLYRQPLAAVPFPLATRLGYEALGNPELAAKLLRAASDQPESTTYALDLPGQETRWIERSILSVYADDNRHVGCMLVLRDITVEKDLQVARDDFTSMIVHDLRAPLTSIAGGLNLLGEFIDLNQNPDVAQTLQIAHRASNRLLALINSLLDISKLESGESELETEYCNLNNICQRIVDELHPIAQEQQINLLFQPVPDLPVANIDPDKITRVLGNLLDNALKFTPANKSVTLVLQALPAEHQILFQVLDEGPGIPEELREKVFDRFTQIKGRQGRRRGSGLGLAFCRLAITAHGGKIWVENRPTGGSAFQFTLPYDDGILHEWDDDLIGDFERAFDL